MHDHLHIHTSVCLYHTHTVSTLPFRHNTHMDTYTRSLSVTQKNSIKKTRVHLKCPNPNKHELELNSNIWKYCSVKNFSRKKKLSSIRGLFSHTHKKVRWMSFERDTMTHRSIDRATAVHALAQDSVSWLW